MLTFPAMTTDAAEWRCPVARVAPGTTAKFRLQCGERRVNGLVVNHEGTVHAYVNRCPHVGTPLDLWDNEFLTDDKRLIVCATHGAMFEPAGGRCVAGPCAGDALAPLPMVVDGDELVVRCPAP